MEEDKGSVGASQIGPDRVKAATYLEHDERMSARLCGLDGMGVARDVVMVVVMVVMQIEEWTLVR